MNMHKKEIISQYRTEDGEDKETISTFYRNGGEFVVEKEGENVVYACWYFEDPAIPATELEDKAGIEQEALEQFFEKWYKQEEKGKES